jgi:hypothetical protein
VKGEATSPPGEGNWKSSKQPQPTTSVPQRPGTVQGLKTCPKCAHLADKIRSGIPLHSLLAYTRCRCHRPGQQKYPGGAVGESGNDPATDINLMVGRERPSTRAANKEQEKNNAFFRRRSLASRRSSKDSSLTRTALPKIDDSIRLESASKDVLVTSFVVSPENPLGIGSGLTSSSKLQKSSALFAPTDFSNMSSSKLSHLPKIPAELRSHITMTTSYVLGVSPSHQRLSVIHEPSRVFVQKNAKPFSILTLVKFIDAHKQKLLKELFVSLDVDDDGHLSFNEVCKGIEPLGLSTPSLHFLHKLYIVLSELTYHGKREFVLTYSVAELLSHGRPPLSNYFRRFAKIDREDIPNVLIPLVEDSHKHASGDGKVPYVQFQCTFHKSRGRRTDVHYPFETISLIEILAFGLLF